jgi:hypothetical protein
VDVQTRAELNHLQRSLGQWALGDVKEAAAAGVKVGSFLLGAHFIDVLARLAKRRLGDGKAAWDEFVPKYLDRYAGHAEALYRGYRGALSHHYSLDGIRLTDGPAEAHRHWKEEEGERVLHLETFVFDLEQAFQTFCADLEKDDEFRERVLLRVKGSPLLGIVGGYDPIPAASAATSPVVLVGGATHFGLSPRGAQSATGSGSKRMAVPKTKKPKR